MRKLFTVFAVIAVALTACKSYDSDIEELNNRVDAITNTQIASLQEQVDAIESTLPALTSTNKELKAYIVELQASYDNLSVALEETNDKIAALKEELQGADAADKSDVLAQLEQIQSDLQSQLNSISNTISTLQTKDSELERQIAELREHVESIANGEGSVDWITATFATLEQHNALVSELSIVKGQIESVIQSIGLLESRLNDKIAADIAAAVAGLNSEIKQKVEEIIDSQNTAIAKSKSEVTAAYTEAIQVAIDASEVSLKKWVNEQLSGYCTLAELEARLVAISNACAQEDDKLRDEIKNLQDELKSATEQITKSYQSAIQDAITTNNGLINDKIAVEIAHINSKIDDQMESVRMSISSLEQRVGLLEAKIATIEEQIANIKSTISSLESVRDELRKNLADLVANGELTQKDIEALKAKDKELLEMILNLQVFVDQKLVGMKDWANATFATLDQYTSLLAELEFIKSTIANVDEEYVKAINEAIGRCESNMRRWVSDQLEGYCTVAELEGRLAALRNKITEGDESLQEEIDALTEALKDAKEELRSEYHAAITAAINNNNGVIDSKISSILSVVNSRINTEISAVNEKLAAIEQRLKRVEDEIASIRTQIGNIMSSIKELESAGAEIKNYVEYLASVDNNLRTEIGEVNEKIDSLEEEMKGEVSTAKAEVLAQLNAMRSYLDSKLTQITEAISALESKDKELDGKISALRSYVDDELNDTKDWAEATFATMEQYTALANEVASIKSYISSLNTAIKDLDSRLTEKINSDIAAAVATLNSSIQQKVKDITDGYTKAVADAKTEITAAYTAAIQSAIGALEVSMQSWVNEQLKGYYTIAEVQAMLAALESEFNDKLSEQKSYLEALINTLSQDVDGRIAANQSAIALLQKKLEELDNSVHTDIASRVAGNAKAIADNAKAIIANAEAIAANGDKITANQSNIEACRSLISKNSTLISENKSAIEELKSSTNGVLARLSTEIATNAEDIAKNSELIAKNAVAINSNSEAIAANTSDIAALNRDLATAKSEIKEAYEAAIAAAIASFDGKLSGEVAEQISAVNTRINSEVAAVNATIDELTTRLTTLEGEVDAIQQQIADMLQDIANIKGDIANLMKRIQSVSYIPKYSDGKATMIKNVGVDEGIAELDFQVSPKDAVKGIVANWQSVLSMKAVYTETRAVSFVDMPILSCTADEANGIITITALGENLSEEFYYEERGVKGALYISDGNNSINTDFIDIIPDVPAYRELRYTTTDDAVITLTKETITDANIVSNTYESGQGVIKFDKQIRAISASAFVDCTTLKSIHIPNSVTTIASRAFSGCTALEDANIPYRVSRIEEMTFYGCSSLQAIEFSDNVEYIGNAAMYGCSQLKTVVIPNSVKYLGHGALHNCSGLEKLTLGCNIETLGCGFDNCTGELIVNCDIPTASSIYNGCFVDSKFTKVTINGSKIGCYAFWDCTTIQELIISDNVKLIEDQAFIDCSGLKHTTIGTGIISGGKDCYGSFHSCTGVLEMNSNVPDAPVSGNADRGFFGHARFSKIIFGERVTYIGRYAFREGPSKLYFKSAVPPQLNSKNVFQGINTSYLKLYVPSSAVDAYKNANIWKEYVDSIIAYDFDAEE